LIQLQVAEFIEIATQRSTATTAPCTMSFADAKELLLEREMLKLV